VFEHSHRPFGDMHMIKHGLVERIELICKIEGMGAKFERRMDIAGRWATAGTTQLVSRFREIGLLT